MTKQIKISLTEEELSNIIQSLFFTSSVDLIFDVDKNKMIELVNIAENLLNKSNRKIDFDFVKVFGNQKTFEDKDLSIRIKRLMKKYGKRN